MKHIQIDSMNKNDLKNIQIGISGAHRTGKTSLALRLSEQLDIPFIETNVSDYKVWERTSIKITDSVTFAERIHIQESILQEMEHFLLKMGKHSYIIDRTPIDVLAYLLTNIDYTTSTLFDTQIKIFIRRVIQLTEFYFNQIVIITPEIPLVNENNKYGKVYNSFALRESLTDIIVGTCFQYLERGVILLPKGCVTLPERLAYITDRITR